MEHTQRQVTMDNVFVTDYESIHGFDLHVAFVDDKLRDEFSERTHISARKTQVINSLPVNFLWCVIFSGKEVETKFVSIEDTGKRDIAVWTPTRATAFVAAPSYEDAEDVARHALIDFVEKHDDLETNVSYDANTGEQLNKNEFVYTTPLQGPIKEAFLHYMRQDDEAQFDTLLKFVLNSKLYQYEDGVIIKFHMSEPPADGSWGFVGEPDLNNVSEEVCHNAISVFDVKRTDVERILTEMALKYSEIKIERSGCEWDLCDFALQVEKQK